MDGPAWRSDSRTDRWPRKSWPWLRLYRRLDHILCYVYKQQLGGCDYSKILRSELDRAGVDAQRVHIDTFGNETSLNSYGHCSHVFLVGILHRDVTQLVGQYLGQIRDITGEITKERADGSTCQNEPTLLTRD